MYSPQSEMLVRARLAEIARASNQQAKSRSSLWITLVERVSRVRPGDI